MIFTDWNNIDPYYFYLRGVLYGIVGTLLILYFLVPKLGTLFKRGNHNKIDLFGRWLLKRFCRKLVMQGHYHRSNIIYYYKVLQEAAQTEFAEDNTPTLNRFLTDCYESSKQAKQQEDAEVYIYMG